MIKRINQTVWELLIGILISGAIIEILGLFVVKDREYFTVGLLVGVVTAILMLFHMNFSIVKALDIGDEGAKKQVIGSYIIRTVAVLAVIGVMALRRYGSIAGVLLGIMTLKVAAYLQPITHKFIDEHKKSQ